MTPKMIQFQLGLVACLVSAFLILIAIPIWVSSPKNVPIIVLSPLFWPYVLSALTGVTGISLLIASRSAGDIENPEHAYPSQGASWVRLAGLAGIMVVTMYALPRLGMVWTTMLVFALSAFLLRTRHPKTAIICAIVVPLALYFFFAHVAGVAIPQGNFVRLP